MDDAGLAERIRLAEATLLSRLIELTNREEHETGIDALEKAMQAIRTLKQERLGV
jgi:hypothetical protein